MEVHAGINQGPVSVRRGSGYGGAFWTPELIRSRTGASKRELHPP